MVFTDLAIEDLANALEEEEEDKNEVWYGTVQCTYYGPHGDNV